VGEVEAVVGTDLQPPAGQAREEDPVVLDGVPWASMAGLIRAKTRAKIGCHLPVDGAESGLAMASPSSRSPSCRRSDYPAIIQVVKRSLE
jgi:hypothetical protein